MDLAEAFAQITTTNKSIFYKPYKYQLAFHGARDQRGELAEQKALMAANQVGKTFSAAMETSYHATGRYPDWWNGKVFDYPVEIIVGSNTNDTCRDICQKELLGDPDDPDSIGTGTIPKECIGKTERKPGVVNGVSNVLVRHECGGNSKIIFRAYEQGAKKWFGHRYDVGWLDEEPPEDIWVQVIRSTFSKKDALLYLTFTPEEGITQVVYTFLNDIQPGQALVRATWNDADHMTPELQEIRLKGIPPRQRKMRTEGEPNMGSGLIFPYQDEEICIDPFPIPNYWPRVCAIDFGIDHPFAAVWVAWNRDTDEKFLYDTYREAGAIAPVHASAIKRRGSWIPVVWPHDGGVRDKGTGKSLIRQYQDEGLNTLKTHFTNPPAMGQKDGTGNISVEAGLSAMCTGFETGTFKVFSNLSEWLDEKSLYHRDQHGRRVDLRDDLISASRYAYQSIRHATTEPMRQPNQIRRQGLRNWQ